MSKKDEESVVVRPRYLETPKGKIPTYDFALGILKAIKLLDDATSQLEEKLSRIEKRGAPGLEGFETRINDLEQAIKKLEKRIELDLEEMNDRLSALTDAFNELMERVQRLEELLTKG